MIWKSLSFLYIAFIVSPVLQANLPESITVYWRASENFPDRGYVSREAPGKEFTLPADMDELKTLMEASLFSALDMPDYQYWSCYSEFVSFPQTTNITLQKKAKQALSKTTLEQLPGYLHPIFRGIVGNEIIVFEEHCRQNLMISWWDVETRMDYNNDTERFEILKNKPETAAPALSSFFPKTWTYPLSEEDYPPEQKLRILRYRVGKTPIRKNIYPVNIWFHYSDHNDSYWLITLPLSLDDR